MWVGKHIGLALRKCSRWLTKKKGFDMSLIVTFECVKQLGECSRRQRKTGGKQKCNSILVVSAIIHMTAGYYMYGACKTESSEERSRQLSAIFYSSFFIP